MLKQKLILTYGIQSVSLVLGVVSGILVARLGGPNVVGTLAFGMAFVSVFQFMTDLGIGTAQQKLVTSSNDIDDYVATYAVLKIASSLLFLIVIVAYFFLQIHFFNNQEINKPEIRTVIFIYIGITFIDSLNYVFRTNFIARTERAKVEIPTFLQSTANTICRILLIVLGFGAVALATSSLAFVVLVLPVNYFLFRNYTFGKFRMDLVKNYLVISVPVIVIMFAQQWTDNIDKILLKQLQGTYELGLYMAAFSLSAPVKLLGSSIGSIFFPSFSSLLFQGRLSEISRLMTTYRKYLVCLILPFIIILIMFSSQIILLLFGGKYRATISYFPIVVITLFIYIYMLPFLNLAYAKGLFRKIATVSIFLLVFQSAVIVLLCGKRRFDMKGLGASIALLITNALGYYLYRRIWNRIIASPFNAKITVLVCIQAILGVGAKFLLKADVLVLFIAVPIVYLGIVFYSEWKMRIMTRADLQFLRGFIRIGSLIQYIKDEMNLRENNEASKNNTSGRL